MAEKFISDRNLKFLLHEVFRIEELIRYPYYEDHSKEIFDMILDTALKVSKDKLFPILEEMDTDQPEFVDGHVTVHPNVRDLMNEFGEGGWINANFSYDLGGQQLPLAVVLASRFVFFAANYSASVYPSLASGSARLIASFGTDEMKDLYLPNMFAGTWQGTMALTEPQAGSSLADITTIAEPTDGGYYSMRGQKIFISAADHDGVDNIIHLMLARIKGAPAGVKGISLFVVPRERIDDSGELVFNDVHVAGIYHKLGYRGAPIVQLSVGENNECRGYLVGEPNKGLSYMFQMMNEQRIDVGLGAAGIASAAYYAALEYTKERPQGRRMTEKDPTLPQVPIIEHADIKRMLLFQRAIVEGSLSLLLQCATYADYEKVLDGEDKEKYSLLLDLLTPVAKSYPSEMGILSVSQGLQCLGGYGYCDEFPLQQYYRDVRIHPIHEGTTGIHGITLLGRNISLNGGKAYQLYLDEVTATANEAREFSELTAQADELRDALDTLEDVTATLLDIRKEGNAELFTADATLYLELFGIISIAWQWLKQAIIIQKALQGDATGHDADFYNGKLTTFRYFFDYELPKIEGLAKTLKKHSGVTIAMNEPLFSD